MGKLSICSYNYASLSLFVSLHDPLSEAAGAEAPLPEAAGAEATKGCLCSVPIGDPHGLNSQP